jgi:signal transduction histidine kinase
MKYAESIQKLAQRLQQNLDFWMSAVMQPPQVKLKVESLAPMILPGIIVFAIQLVIAAFFDSTPSAYGVISAGTGLVFTVIAYVMARHNRLNVAILIISATLMIFAQMIIFRPANAELLYYTVMLLILAWLYTPPLWAMALCSLNILCFLLLPALMPGYSLDILHGALRYYAIVSTFVFASITFFKSRLIAQEQERQQMEAAKIQWVLQEERQQVTDRFVHAFSHYFRNQLSIVEANRYIVARRTADDEAAQQRLERIALVVQQMREQLDNLRLVAKLEPGMVMPCDLNGLVEVMYHEYKQQAEELGIRLVMLLAETPPIALINPTHLRSAVRQLIGNALNHTPAGGTIRLGTRRDDAGVYFDVEDSGPGIDPVLLPEMFEFFRKGDTAMPIQKGGIGLGLSIVKMVAEAYSGGVSVSSEVGRGSVFTIRLLASANGDEWMLDTRPTKMPKSVKKTASETSSTAHALTDAAVVAASTAAAATLPL